MEQPLVIEYLPNSVAGKNLSNKMPDVLWKQLREKAFGVYENQCFICQTEAERLSLHESWKFFWYQDREYSVAEWHDYAAGKGWPLYESGSKRYEVKGRQVPRQSLSVQEEANLPALIESGFTPHIDGRGGFRYADEEFLRPYQVLIALVLVCPHCHSVKNLEKMRRLAEQGKFDIEPVLQHYMRVNKVSKQEALKQWAFAREEAKNDPIVWNCEPIIWEQQVQNFGADGRGIEVYTPLSEWIANIRSIGVEAVSPHLFLATS